MRLSVEGLENQPSPPAHRSTATLPQLCRSSGLPNAVTHHLLRTWPAPNGPCCVCPVPVPCRKEMDYLAIASAINLYHSYVLASSPLPRHSPSSLFSCSGLSLCVSVSAAICKPLRLLCLLGTRAQWKRRVLQRLPWATALNSSAFCSSL